nr:hypothetical protein [Tanacetum cinerariifolium]
MNENFGLMGIDKVFDNDVKSRVCSEVSARNELESHNLVKPSEEVDKHNKILSIHLSEDDDSGREENFSSDLGVNIDCVGCIFVEVKTTVEKTAGLW